MNAYDRKAAKAYSAFAGTVSASYADFVRVAGDAGSDAGFRVGAVAARLPPGTRVSILALRDTNEPAFVVNCDSGERIELSIWREGPGKGYRGLLAAMGVVAFVILLIPFIGQFAAFVGGLGVIIGGAITSSTVKGSPPVPYLRVLLALAVYFPGSFIFFSGWMSGNSSKAQSGYAVLAVGAAIYGFFVPRGRILFLKALNRLMDSGCRAIASGEPALRPSPKTPPV